MHSRRPPITDLSHTEAPQLDGDDAHAAFGAALLDILRVVIGQLATAAPMTPEALRDRLTALIENSPPGIRQLPLRRIVEDLDEIIRTRDEAAFDKTVSLAKAAGRVGVDEPRPV